MVARRLGYNRGGDRLDQLHSYKRAHQPITQVPDSELSFGFVRPMFSASVPALRRSPGE